MQLRADRIQEARYKLSGDLVDPWPIQVIRSPVIERPVGLTTVFDALLARYRAAQEDRQTRLRPVIAGLLLMAGADREAVREVGL